MRLIILNGPPASGKFTIGEEISRRTGYKLFDNHTLIDLLSSLTLGKSSPFNPKTSQKFWKLYRDLRVNILDSACKMKDIGGMIITEAYSGKKRFFNSLIGTAEKNKCSVYLINLNCHRDELGRRVCEKSRLKFNKLHDKKGLDKWMDKYEKRNLIYSYRKMMTLDNTCLSAKSSADKILKFIGYRK